MEPLMVVLFLVLNFGISWWNAYSSGAYLTESKIIGGWIRLVVWCGLIMSACGFTWVYVTLLTIGAVQFGYLTPYWGDIMFKLGYLTIIIPVIASGFGIWAHSIAVFYRERNLRSGAVAAWNTYAQFHNTWEAASHAGSALDDVIEAFAGKGSRRGKNDGAALLVILLVVLAVIGGALTTAAIARRADRKVAIDVTGGGRERGSRFAEA